MQLRIYKPTFSSTVGGAGIIDALLRGNSSSSSMNNSSTSHGFGGHYQAYGKYLTGGGSDLTHAHSSESGGLGNHTAASKKPSHGRSSSNSAYTHSKAHASNGNGSGGGNGNGVYSDGNDANTHFRGYRQFKHFKIFYGSIRMLHIPELVIW